jgi:cytochrome d ubiquinol oxidase subunit I
MTPSGFIAILAGWFVTEVGRQPYVVYNILRTSEVSSPVLGQYIFASLIAFVIVYAFIFGGDIYYIITLIKKGPSTTTIVTSSIDVY